MQLLFFVFYMQLASGRTGGHGTALTLDGQTSVIVYNWDIPFGPRRPLKGVFSWYFDAVFPLDQNSSTYCYKICAINLMAGHCTEKEKQIRAIRMHFPLSTLPLPTRADAACERRNYHSKARALKYYLSQQIQSDSPFRLLNQIAVLE